MPVLTPIPQVWAPTLLHFRLSSMFILTSIPLYINVVWLRSQSGIGPLLLQRMVLKGNFLPCSDVGASIFGLGHSPIWQCEE